MMLMNFPQASSD